MCLKTSGQFWWGVNTGGKSSFPVSIEGFPPLSKSLLVLGRQGFSLILSSFTGQLFFLLWRRVFRIFIFNVLVCPGVAHSLRGVLRGPSLKTPRTAPASFSHLLSRAFTHSCLLSIQSIQIFSCSCPPMCHQLQAQSLLGLHRGLTFTGVPPRFIRWCLSPGCCQFVMNPTLLPKMYGRINISLTGYCQCSLLPPLFSLMSGKES